MRNFFGRFLATVLLAAFSAYLVPDEFVHALYSHEDTHDTGFTTDKAAVGTQHIHCGFLSYEASLYTASSFAKCPVSFDCAFAFVAPAAVHAGVTFTFCPSLRGPPASV